MRAVIQRVSESSVTVDGKVVGSSQKGYMILLGVVRGDTDENAQLLARKTAALRVFEDENGKMNKSVIDIDGEILAISQFTLCADCKKGNRPVVHKRNLHISGKYALFNTSDTVFLQFLTVKLIKPFCIFGLLAVGK